MRFLLLRSPLMGPLSWRSVAAELERRGHRAELADWPRLSELQPPYYRAIAAAVASGAAEGPGPILAAHSAAGALVPSVAAAVGGAAGAVFVDAILPHPGRSWLQSAPPELAAELRAGAEDGRLPSWDQWWPPGALARLLPDAELRAQVTEELEALPLAYLEEAAPDLPLDVPAAYLQMSTAYEAEAAQARANGWPAAGMPRSHLAMLTHPQDVAAALEALGASLVGDEEAPAAR